MAVRLCGTERCLQATVTGFKFDRANQHAICMIISRPACAFTTQKMQRLLAPLLMTLLVAPSDSTGAARQRNADGCASSFAELHPPWSCRFGSALRLPSVLVPLDAAGCTTKPADRCSSRSGNWSLASVPPPRLYVAITTIPPRAGPPLQHAVDSIFKQRRLPDKLIVSASDRYKRFGDANVDLASLRADDGLHPNLFETRLKRLSSCEDLGPGTKLLCALPVLRSLAAAEPDGRRAFVVLLDDDLRYRRFALQWLELAIQSDGRGERRALSYDVYTLTPEGHAVLGGLYPGLLVGAGHALFAFEVRLLDGIEAFFQCVRALEPRATYHDDVVISMFLQDVRGEQIYRIGGTAWEFAAKTFPDVHETTVSFLSKGALLSLGNSAAEAAAATTKVTRKDAAISLANVSLVATGTIRGRRAKAHNKRKDTADDSTSTGTSTDTSAADAAALSMLDGGQAALALAGNGTSVSEARKAYFSRRAVNLAMGAVRARILENGLCGVAKGAPACVGAWCKSKDWGGYTKRAASS